MFLFSVLWGVVVKSYPTEVSGSPAIYYSGTETSPLKLAVDYAFLIQKPSSFSSCFRNNGNVCFMDYWNGDYSEHCPFDAHAHSVWESEA